ncbi:TRAP transporter large permease [Hwanghaeella sp. LZ110]|uniref:TRAP transporter large permease n=1 Tax=Hwanghaeella sp. LZ110 TaxID=3402810 RepID=UPI003B66FA66
MTADVVIPLLMIALLIAGILSSYPVALVLGGTATLALLVSDLPISFANLLVSRVYGNILTNWLFLSIPMFIAMGLLLEMSGFAARALVDLQRAFGNRRGGLGVAVILIGALMAAATGVVGASVVMLTLLSLPKMQNQGYSNDLAGGIVAASGTLAILMPPSIMLIILSDQLGVGVGDLFAGSIVPSAILIGLYLAYTILRATLYPDHAPAARQTERFNVWQILIGIGPLLVLIFCVLGAIIFGIASPTEASGVGALGAALLTFTNGRMTGPNMRRVSIDTMRNTTAVLFLAIGATCFSAVFRGVGGEDLIVNVLEHAQLDAWGTLIVLMMAMIVMGFFLDWLEIVLILLPIFGPIVAGLDFGNGLDTNHQMIWFAIIVAVNLQTSFLTPPFGFSLFYMRSASRGTISNRDTYRGVLPFVALQLLTLLIIIVWPGILI